MWFMLSFLIAKHFIFHAFDAHLAPFSLLFMSNHPTPHPFLYVYFVEMEEKINKNQENWMRNEENVQTVVIVTITYIHCHNYDSKLEED